jgi:hypothetical protein
MSSNLEKSPWEQWKENLGKTRPWDFVNINSVSLVSKERAEERLAICKACPKLIQLTGTCKKCGCFMAAKVKLAKASCPINKWQSE